MSIRPLIAAGLMVMLVACSRVTLDNYNQLTVGMSYDAVTQLLGKPAQCDDMMGIRSCRWGDDSGSIQVNFVAGQVLLFSSSRLR